MAESKVERTELIESKEMNVYAQLTKSPERIAPPEITSVDPAVDDNVIRAVDTYYDTLESARQALLETLYQKGFEVFFNGMWAQKAIGRITRKMAVLRLKREQWFHKWTPEQVMEYAPYWKELITPSYSTLKRFCKAENIDAYMVPRYKINVARAIKRVYDIIRRRNDVVNSTHDDNLESHIESVVNAYVDNFEIVDMTTFLNNIYHKMLRKKSTSAPMGINVYVDADTDYVIQTVRRIMQKRADVKRKRLEKQEQKRAEEEQKRVEEEQKRVEEEQKRAETNEQNRRLNQYNQQQDRKKQSNANKKKKKKKKNKIKPDAQANTQSDATIEVQPQGERTTNSFRRGRNKLKGNTNG